ncbi:piggyBac transposable element-derived protein 4-like [Polyodon spathula]|uniref:piggyBac transposable element-derived protein 4-like n=1 Tax=Polyodon spathula TaxID=7913 RepID=UPI001B7ECF3D|nr:piggyBac transposable element-derived protein 4-like [Polyodon spathula]
MLYSDSGESESFSGSNEDCAHEDGLESFSTEAFTDSGMEDEKLCGTEKSGQPVKKLSWKKELPGQTRLLSAFHFNKTPGMTCEVADKNSALSYFSLFFIDDLMAMILKQTNKCAAENPPAVSTAEFQDIEMNKLWCFFGLFIVKGIIPKPSICDYWTIEFLTQTPAFHYIMLRKSFTDIAKNAHVVDNYDPAPWESGKLWKVCGTKSYTVCESGTGKSGYIWNYKVYSGKGTAGGALKSQKTVTNLLHGLENRGYIL